MNALAFLLLLDFSGSMDQPLQNRTKIEILKQETVSLISTADPSSQSTALIFGTNPQKDCRDMESLTLTTPKLSQKIQTLRPGNLGKTPLALGLREMVKKSIQKNAQVSLVVTDGADSCGEDPCKALIAGNAELAKVQKKLKVHIIGFDLKNENAKFQCFNDLKLSNIEVSMSEASSSSDLQRKIREGQMGSLEPGPTLKDADTARLKGLQKNAVADTATGQGQNKTDTSRGAPIFDKKTEALLEVLGAPATARFSATSKKGKRNWQGSYVITLQADSYAVRFEDANGAEVHLDLGAGTQTRIPWARLMKVVEASVKLQSPTLSLKWSPDEPTKTVHGELEDITSQALVEPTDTIDQKVPFGNWNLEIVSPPWLKSLAKRHVHFNFGAQSQMNIEMMYQDQVKWIQNPRPNSMQVLRIIIKGKSEERYPIQPGLKRVPIPMEAEALWMLPKP